MESPQKSDPPSTSATPIFSTDRSLVGDLRKSLAKTGQDLKQVDSHAKALFNDAKTRGQDFVKKGQQMGEMHVENAKALLNDAKTKSVDFVLKGKDLVGSVVDDFVERSQDIVVKTKETGQEVVSRVKSLPDALIKKHKVTWDESKTVNGAEVLVSHEENPVSRPSTAGNVDDPKSPGSPFKMSLKAIDLRAYPDTDGFDDIEETGKLKWKEGRYKLGKKQFLSNPYIFIPAKMMLQPSFNFGHIFKDFGVSVPALIFRLSRSRKTSTWNVKLPQSRKHLAQAAQKLREAKAKQGGNTNHGIKSNPQHADLLIDPDAVAKYKLGKESLVEKLRLLRLEDVIGKPPSEENAYLKNLRGSIDHYRGVLEENSRRLLRNVNSACIQAQTLYCVNEVWSDEVDEDVVAQWVLESNPKGSTPMILGIADKTDFHPDVWAQLRDGCQMDYAQKVKDQNEPDEVIIDPQPFFEREIRVQYDEMTGYPTKSIPHPLITHLVISDNRTLLEQKIAEVVLWGMLLVNGSIRDAELCISAVQQGLPVIALKYTGGAADIFVEMYDKVDKWVQQKRNKQLANNELPQRAFPDDIAPGFQPPSWLLPMDQSHIVCCNMMNLLLENWPDRHNKASVFVIDMFDTPEDEVQDRLTQTVGVVSAGDYELGGVSSEQRRVSFAWRCRHKFLTNASFYRRIADLLQLLLIFFTFASTMLAAIYTFILFEMSTHLEASPMEINYTGVVPTSSFGSNMYIILLLNILLPLLGTVVRGINSAISPYMKYVALANACVRIESEVYAFRCKVGNYSTLKLTDDDDEEEGDEDGQGEKSGGDDAGLPNPRKAFCQAIDRIWQDLAVSDLQNGSLRSPLSLGAALDDINTRIRSNRREQETYLNAMPRRLGDGDDNAKEVNKKKKSGIMGNGDGPDSDEESTGCWGFIQGVIARGAKISPMGDSVNAREEDGVSPLTADDYVVLRLVPMIAYMTNAAPSYSYCRFLSQAVNIALSVMASALSAFGLIPFIPAVLATSGAVTSLTQYYQIELRLLQTNAARSQLHQLIVWWESLSLIEKRVMSNKNILVKKTEAAIQSQATIFQGGGGGDDDNGGDSGSGKD